MSPDQDDDNKGGRKITIHQGNYYENATIYGMNQNYAQQNDFMPVIQTMEEMRKALSSTTLQPEALAEINEKIKAVEERVAQPGADRKLILERLEILSKVLGTVTAAAGMSETVQKLEPFVKTAIHWLQQTLH
jgi:hypothetical protein